MMTCIFIWNNKRFLPILICDVWLFCKPLCECPIHCWALYHFKNLFSPPTSYYLFSFINILSIVISFASFIFFYIFIIIMTRFVFLWDSGALTKNTRKSLQHVIHVLLHFCNIPTKCFLMIRSKIKSLSSFIILP